TTQEITIVFFSYAYLDVSVQRVRVFIRHVFNMPGYPIRKSADQFVYANTRSLSQLITSFIASESQGIPRVPLLTFFSMQPFCYCIDAYLDNPYNHRVNTMNYRDIPTVVFSIFLFSSNMSKNVLPAV